MNTSRRQIGEGAATKTGADFLRAHLVWEAEYTSRALATKVEPHEIAIQTKDTGLPGQGLFGWFAMPAMPGIPAGYEVFATFELADHVVGLSARTLGDLEPVAVMRRLEPWLRTFRSSPRYISPRTVGAEIRAKIQAGEQCPPQPSE